MEFARRSCSPRRRRARVATSLALLLATASFAAAAVQEPRRPRFDPEADAAAEIRAATEIAAKRAKRVLVVWGADGLAGSRELVAALDASRRHTGWPLDYEYERVLVDVGDGTRRRALAASLDADFAAGLPLVSVLDGKGAALLHVPAARWRTDDGYAVEEIARFLARHRVPPRDAEEELARGLAEAKRTDRRLLVRLGAPW